MRMYQKDDTIVIRETRQLGMIVDRRMNGCMIYTILLTNGEEKEFYTDELESTDQKLFLHHNRIELV